jgi:hypothetical protein
MDLPTHFFFGLAVGFVFFGHTPELALLVGLGALLPDLDREYWFIPEKQFAEEQRHRALFHNVFVIALTFVISPFLSLGVFLHVLQDSFTTVKDRGVEWFYPLTRLVKRGRYDGSGNEQPSDPKEHVYFFQEDLPGLVKYADADLQETLDRPIPWRRVYGFALNSHLLDRGFLFGSIVVLLTWIFVPTPAGTFPDLALLTGAPISVYEVWLLGLIAVGVLYLAGEIDRKDKVRASLNRLKPIKIPVLVVGLVLLGMWGYYYGNAISSDVMTALAFPLQIVVVAVLIPIVAFVLVRVETKGGKQPATI